MKNTTLLVCAFVLLTTACKKENGTGGSESGSSQQLIPASTGWQRVSVIPYQNAVSGGQGLNSMSAYDLTWIGNDPALLYSDNYKFVGVNGHTIMKLMLNSGTVDAKAKAVKLNYDRGDNATQVHRFIPGSFNTISARFLNNECLLYDETGGPNAGQNFGSINALPTVRWYSDGSILAGLKDGTHSSASWYYKYPAKGDFKYTVNVWNGDPTTNILSSPMKLSDNVVYDLVLSKQNGTMYFSVIKNINAPQAGTAPNYETICRNTFASLDATKEYYVVSSDVQNDAHTILLAELTSSRDIAKLIAVRWRKGTTTLEQLYSVGGISSELSRDITTLTTNISFANEVRLTPDGTTYFLREYAPSQGGSGAYTALVLINKDGVKELGKLNSAEMHSIKLAQFKLGCCRYFNGAYYALFYPTEEVDYTINAPEFRMELVKLTP